MVLNLNLYNNFEGRVRYSKARHMQTAHLNEKKKGVSECLTESLHLEDTFFIVSSQVPELSLLQSNLSISVASGPGHTMLLGRGVMYLRRDV